MTSKTVTKVADLMQSFIFSFYVITYSLGCGASCDPSDILTVETLLKSDDVMTL